MSSTVSSAEWASLNSGDLRSVYGA